MIKPRNLSKKITYIIFAKRKIKSESSIPVYHRIGLVSIENLLHFVIVFKIYETVNLVKADKKL